MLYITLGPKMSLIGVLTKILFKSLAELSFEAPNQSKVRYTHCRLLVHSNFRRLPDVLPSAEVLPTTPEVPPKHLTRHEKAVLANESHN